jgi:hypothetical protein
MNYQLDLCTDFVKVGEAEAYQFDAIVRNLAVGEWVLSAPAEGLIAPDLNAVDSVLVYNEAGRIVFAGLVRPYDGNEGGTLRTVDAESSTIEFSGIDLWGLLAMRRVWPDPTGSPPWSVSHDVRTGVASTVAAEFIDANMGSTAIADRAIAGLEIVDPAAGLTSSWSGRLQPLSEMVANICRDAGLTCRAEMRTPGVIRFIIGSPYDQSDRYLFTDQGDLEGVARLMTPAQATYVLGAGQGELTARAFAVASGGQSGLDRVEVVYENTNITVTGELEAAVARELSLATAEASVEAVLSPSAAQSIDYLDDYNLGDHLGVEIEGVRYAPQVEAVRFSFSPDRQLITPLLGRTSADPLKRLLSRVASLQSQFDTQIL